MSKTKEKNIFQRMCEIQRNITHIGKDSKNNFHGFNFRGIDTVYNELHGLLAEHGVFSVPTVLEERAEERTSNNNKTTIYRILKIKYSFYSEDGSSVDCIVIGEGMDTGDKAANKAMAIAHKYALLQVFTVPTSEQKDPDAESHDLKPKGQNQPQQPVDDNSISDSQGKMIWALSSKLWPKNTKEEIATAAKELGVPGSSKDMTKKDASKLISRLKELQELSKKGQEQPQENDGWPDESEY